MRRNHDGGACFERIPVEQIQELSFAVRVEIGGRLVGHDHTRTESECLQHQHPLAFATAQLMRIGLQEARAVEADRSQQVVGPLRGAGQLGDLLADRQERGEAGERLLRDIANTAVDNPAATHRCRGRQQAGNGLQKRRLAAPGLSGDTQPFPVIEGDRYGGEHRLPRLIPDAQLPQFEEGHALQPTKCGQGPSDSALPLLWLAARIAFHRPRKSGRTESFESAQIVGSRCNGPGQRIERVSESTCIFIGMGVGPRLPDQLPALHDATPLRP